MKLQKLLFLSLLILAITACCPEVEQDTFSFDVETVTPVNFDLNTIDFISSANGSISASSFGLVIETTAPGIANARPKKRGGGIFRSPDCDGIVDPIFSLNDSIVSMLITATEDFSPDYPAGSNLNDLFRTVRITKDNPFATPQSFIDDWQNGIDIDYLNSHTIGHHDAADYRNQQTASFYGLKLQEQPSAPVLLQFELTLNFQSGRSMSGSTAPINIGF